MSRISSQRRRPKLRVREREREREWRSEDRDWGCPRYVSFVPMPRRSTGLHLEDVPPEGFHCTVREPVRLMVFTRQEKAGS